MPVADRDRLEVAAAPVRLHEVVRAGRAERVGDLEVATRLRNARVDGVREQVVANDEVRACPKRCRREPDREREGDRQASAEPSGSNSLPAHQPASKR